MKRLNFILRFLQFVLVRLLFQKYNFIFNKLLIIT
ncbi:hypothetical protein Syn7502_03109 [Synechococcus sp. PCC 7502]|nr:hypothetical protein Syn7502_03109 [Synechococcus sp. PCC 7502]